jgi:predicted RNA-binding Zn-ribbon protein involved in translation (DUF1610 family)
MKVIKCPSCGVDNLDDASKCRMCFKPMVVDAEISPVASAPVLSAYAEFVCLKCGYVGYQKQYMKGAFAMEVLLWGIGLIGLLIIIGIFVLVFALGYSLWRLVNRYVGCPACGEAGMISVNSPVARKFLVDLAK